MIAASAVLTSVDRQPNDVQGNVSADALLLMDFHSCGSVLASRRRATVVSGPAILRSGMSNTLSGYCYVLARKPAPDRSTKIPEKY
jgi:hypothetical protein